MTNPRVSICIPTYDRLHYLQEAVASARAQTLTDIEIVIGDDGDSAELRAWCLGQAAKDPRVRYYKTPGRLRLAGNWSFLADHARGTYATFIGDDDRLLPNFAARLLAEAIRCSADERPVDVVFSHHHLIDSAGRRDDGGTRAATHLYGRDVLPEGPIANVQAVVWGNTVPVSAAIIRAEVVRRLRFKSDINTPELELFVRMAVEGSRFVFVREYLAEYRVHAGSETASGLTIDRLAEHLQGVSTSSDAEAAKTRLLARMLVIGVGIRLQRGDLSGARALSMSSYYPRDLTNVRASLQRYLLSLPDDLIAPAYASLRWLRQTVRHKVR